MRVDTILSELRGESWEPSVKGFTLLACINLIQAYMGSKSIAVSPNY